MNFEVIGNWIRNADIESCSIEIPRFWNSSLSPLSISIITISTSQSFLFSSSFFLQISRTAKTALYPAEEYVIFSIVFPIVETVRLSIDVEIEWISEVPLFIFAIAIEKDVHT